jgi:signal transduction histidine kinase
VPLTAYPSSRTQTERVIAPARIALSFTSLFAVWIDPSGPSRFFLLTIGLHILYVGYSALLALLIRVRGVGDDLPIVSHIVDIVLFSIFQYLTPGPSSPFFLNFIFSLFCGAMRWGWRGTLGTAGFVMFEYSIMGVSMSRTFGDNEFGLNRFLVRGVYLAITAWLLVYLGRYETRMRQEIERLARWPAATGADVSGTASHVLQHASQIVGASRAVVVWEAGEEPTVHVAEWSPAETAYSKHSPGALKPLVDPALEDASFLGAGDFRQHATILVGHVRGRQGEWSGVPVNAQLLDRVHGTGIASAPFRVGSVTGRVFFTDLTSSAAETLPLTELVAREIGGSLDQLHVTKQLQEVAAGEERIRLARDLHDGVLQSLTGVRLEIRAVAGLEGIAAAIRERLVAIERALAGEQRELRFFIADLEPDDGRTRNDSPLAHRLQALLKRIALEWKTPVTIRVADQIAPVSQQLEQAVPLMVHEAVVNALKHGHPSRVTVSVEGHPGELRIVVTDDGRGFPFRGHYNHQALVEGRTGPKSLLERVTALGGEMSIDSSDSGARVELRLST